LLRARSILSAGGEHRRQSFTACAQHIFRSGQLFAAKILLRVRSIFSAGGQLFAAKILLRARSIFSAGGQLFAAKILLRARSRR